MFAISQIHVDPSSPLSDLAKDGVNNTSKKSKAVNSNFQDSIFAIGSPTAMGELQCLSLRFIHREPGEHAEAA